MEKSEKKKYLSVGLGVGMTGIDLLMVMFFIPLIFILPLFMKMELVQLVYFILVNVSAFFIIYRIRKRRTNEKFLPFSIPKKSILPFIIIGGIALVYGIMNPIFDFLPMPDIFAEESNYQSLVESLDNKYPFLAENMGDKYYLLIERFTENYPLGVPTFIMMVVVAPIFEELIYRGIILDGLLKRYSATTSILVSSILFGIIHMNLPQVFPAIVAGIFMGWVYYRTKNLTLTILIHACMNLTGFIEGVLWNPQYESSIEFYGGLKPYIFIMIISIVVFVICVLWLRKIFNKQDSLVKNLKIEN